jgi:hypothetical protein
MRRPIGLTETRGQAAKFERAIGRKPCLATVLVGDDPASHTYVRMIGYGTRHYSAGLPEEYGGIEYGGLPVSVGILHQVN